MKYDGMIEGRFIKRLNRFVAEVLIDGVVEMVHVKNTGRCRELFIEGAKVYLQESDNPNRKTKYSLISIYKEETLVNVDSQVPNQVVYEALVDGSIEEIGEVTFAKREVTYGDSRFDIYYETRENKGYIEVKGVTLEENRLAKFPDAPTTRGTKHVNGLVKGNEEGYKNYVFFLIQMEGVKVFRPHHERDVKFADALYNAVASGVKVLAYTSRVTRDSIELDHQIDVLPKSY